MTWVGVTNTFIVSTASLVTAVATLIWVIRGNKSASQTQSAVAEVHAIAADTNDVVKVIKNGH